ncbi:MAG: hypothetical protein PHO76_13050 [Methylotenera sp.]|nr:hypothetical protein [Methylotenera sp.]MDD4926142.1 hypothetical protein [Methylotenera sp.]
MLKDILDDFANATAIDAIRAIPDRLDANQIARIAEVQVAIPTEPIGIDCDSAVSNWWRITFEGLAPVQVAIWPPCTKAEALARNPNATSIKPMPTPILKVIPINTAHELVDTLRSCGYMLHVNADDALVVDQIGWVDDELSDLITKHKLELINILKS